MGDNFSTKEFVENNIRYFQFIKDKTELMTLGYITYQKLQVAGDDEREMIVFTDGNKWYKTPYTKEMYTLMLLNNSSIFEENIIKKFVSENIKTFPIPTQKEFYALGNVIYENLIIARDGNDEYVVFSVGNNFYKIPYAKAAKKEDDVYEYLRGLNDEREEEKEKEEELKEQNKKEQEKQNQLNMFIMSNIGSFPLISNQQELNDLGNIFYENLRVIRKNRVDYIIFSKEKDWFKIIYNEKLLKKLNLLNQIKIKEIETKLFIAQNITSFTQLTTKEQLAALGPDPSYANLQIAIENGKEFIVFKEREQYYKVFYNRDQKPDIYETYKAAREAKRKRVEMPHSINEGQSL